MKHTTEMNLETYLKQATRGIWGKRKQDAILELRGNIEARIWTLEHQGKTQAEALKIALQELGDAQAVNAGMTQVHTMPNVTRNILLAGLISSVAAVGWTSSTAQIQTVVPSIQGICCQMLSGIQQPQFVSLNDFKATLQQAGVTVDESMQPPAKTTTQTFDNWPSVAITQTRTLDLHFPEMTEGETVRVQALSGFSVTADGQNPKFIEDEDIFIDPNLLINQLRKANLPMTLEGWHNPRLKIGQTSLIIGTQERPMTGVTWYRDVMHKSLGSDELTLDRFTATSDLTIMIAWNQPIPGVLEYGKHIYSIRTNDRPGKVYGLFLPQIVNTFSTTGSKEFRMASVVFYSLARVNDQGVLQFVDGSAKVIEFVNSFQGIADDLEFVKANKYDPARLEKLGYGSAKRPAKAMLVRLTGRLDTNTTEIVVPAKPRLMASPR
jgi:hypothetical protein